MHPRPNCRYAPTKVQIVDGNIMIIESDEAPNLPPGLIPEGHV